MRTLAALLLAAPFAHAGVPQLLQHEGRLLRADGTAERGSAQLVFKLYTAVDATAAVWTETQSVALGSDGYYATHLGISTQLPSFAAAAHWLGITVQGEQEMSPRVALGSVAYALHAALADSAANAVALGGRPAAEIVYLDSTLDAAKLTGTVPAGALPPPPAIINTTTLTATTVTADTFTLAGGASLFTPFDGVQRPCPNGTAMQTFSAATNSWSACPILWNCTATPDHAGCVSSSQYRSCKEIRADTTFNGADGLFWVDPDTTAGGLPPVRVYCDMATEGGGWTLVARITGSPGWAHDDCGTVATLTAPDQGSTAKLSDQAINALDADVYKLSCRSLITYWDARSRPFNACSDGGSNRRGKNGLSDPFLNLAGDNSGRGITANDVTIGSNAYYGYNPSNTGTPGCHSAGVWGSQGWMMAR